METKEEPKMDNQTEKEFNKLMESDSAIGTWNLKQWIISKRLEWQKEVLMEFAKELRETMYGEGVIMSLADSIKFTLDKMGYDYEKETTEKK